MASEPWSWAKWLKGHLSISRYGKDIGTLIRIVIIIAIGLMLFWGFITIKQRLFPKQLSSGEHIDKSSIASNAGTITQLDSHEAVTVVHNHSPLENGLLGLIFGAKDQTVKESKGN